VLQVERERSGAEAGTSGRDAGDGDAAGAATEGPRWEDLVAALGVATGGATTGGAAVGGAAVGGAATRGASVEQLRLRVGASAACGSCAICAGPSPVVHVEPYPSSANSSSSRAASMCALVSRQIHERVSLETIELA